MTKILLILLMYLIYYYHLIHKPEPLVKKEPIMGLEYTEDEKKLEYELLKEKIENIQDLINLGTKYKNESYYRKKKI